MVRGQPLLMGISCCVWRVAMPLQQPQITNLRKLQHLFEGLMEKWLDFLNRMQPWIRSVVVAVSGFLYDFSSIDRFTRLIVARGEEPTGNSYFAFAISMFFSNVNWVCEPTFSILITSFIS